MQTTPPSLLERLRNGGTEQDWHRFVELYTPSMVIWAKQMGLQDHDVHDLIQDVYLLLHDRFSNFVYDPKLRFHGWLRTVVKNAWLGKLRKKQPDNLPPEIDIAFTEECQTEDFLMILRQALRILRSDFRDTTWSAFSETWLKGRGIAEVAQELNISENAVSQARFRVMSALRREFQDLLD